MVWSPRSPPEEPDQRLDRRHFLTTASVVTTAAIAGCSGRLPGSQPRDLDTEIHTNSATELSWAFPPESSDQDHAGIGYVELRREPKFDSDTPTPTLGFHFNTSIAPYSNYTLNQFSARFATPTSYQQQHGDLTYFVEPPTHAGNFQTRYRQDSTRREFVVKMQNIGPDGTLQFPIVLYGTTPLPSRLHCRFSLQASTSGLFSETINASQSGTFNYGTTDDQQANG